MKRMSCEFTICQSVEKRIDVSFGVERNEIVDLLAGADEANGHAELAGDGNDDAALRGAVELGQNDAGDADRRCELACLREAVLSRGGVENEKNIVRRAGNDFSGGALHF